VEESEIPDKILANLSKDLFGGGRDRLAEELKELEREDARRRKALVVGSVAGLVGGIIVIAVAWWLFA
jgi:hypothetical protein